MPRRPRYRGTHPRRFDEKYKELDPERFPDAAAKAVERGSTPAGTHVPVLVDDVIAALAPQAGETLLDATLGWGGHAEALAGAARGPLRIFALDRDGEELARAVARLAARGIAVSARHGNASGAAKFLRDEGETGADMALADLGCSSMQLDRPERGFSFKNDGALDMRMDRSRPGTAADWLAATGEAELAAALAEFGDEPDAAAVAREVVRRRGAGRAVATTADLVAVVLAAKGLAVTRWRRENAFDAHPAARTFQAVRIAVNREHEHLAQFLRDLPWIVRPGGRAAAITFHSGEERRVRASFEQGAAAGLWTMPLADPIVPSPDERRRNPRSRSARLHVALRT